MRKHRRILFIILLTAIAGALAWLILRPGEPTYQGKPLSYWLGAYSFGIPVSSFQREMADEAVRHIGTNAIPTILALLRERDSPLKIQFLELLQKQKLVTVTITNTPAWQKHFVAVNGLRVLGRSASNASPDLVAIYQLKSSAPFRSYILTVLGEIGPSAGDIVPFLVNQTTSSQALERHESLNILATIHAQPDLTIPACLKCVGSSEPFYVRQSAVNALAAFGNLATNAVPRLVKLLQDPEPLVRESVTNALKAIDPDAAAKAGVQIISP